MSVPNRMFEKRFLLGGVLVLLTLAAYLPAIEGGFVWDDDEYVEHNPTLRTAEGLRRIWFEPGATPQYYPLVFSTFWAEYHLWHLHPAGYHLINVLLHAANALLLGLVLRRLAVPGAWLAAALFALHPVLVESVAWVTELKNVLSGFFYITALLAYLRFSLPEETEQRGTPQRRGARSEGRKTRGNQDRKPEIANSKGQNANLKFAFCPLLLAINSWFGPGGWGCYALALVLFLGALLSKTVTCSLPAVLLLILWWKRGRVTGRDLAALAPFFAIGLLLARQTVWMEKHTVGAEGEEWNLSFVERCLVAGRALWFYAGKLAWPAELTFIYPRWHLDPRAWWQYVFPGAVVAVVAGLWWAQRRLGRGPLVAVLIFAGTLVPALGFFDVYPMRYSFVADHFQYLASAALLALAAAAAVTAFERFGPPERWKGAVAAGLLLGCLALLTAEQARIYKSREVLWTDTLKKNPACRMAHNNLGTTLAREGRFEEARGHFEAAIRLDTRDPRAHFNLAQLYAGAKRPDEAAREFRETVRISPHNAEAHYNLGSILVDQGHWAEASEEFAAALRLKPDYTQARATLIGTLVELGKLDEAVQHLSPATESDPDFADVYNALGAAFARQGRLDAAATYYRQAVQLEPASARHHYGLGAVLERLGQTAAAQEQYRKARESDPNWPVAASQTAWALATDPDPGARNGALAMELARQACQATGNQQPAFVDIFAAACAEAGRFDEAVTAARLALTLAGAQPDLEKQIQQRLVLYQEHKPFHRTATARPR